MALPEDKILDLIAQKIRFRVNIPKGLSLEIAEKIWKLLNDHELIDFSRVDNLLGPYDEEDSLSS